jgi:hypothetical protein
MDYHSVEQFCSFIFLLEIFMTSVNLELAFVDTDNSPLTDKNNTPSTFKSVSMYALTAVTAGDASEALPKKMARWELYKKISRCPNSSVNLTSEEVILLKERVNMTYGALVVGQLVDHITESENDSVKPKT